MKKDIQDEVALKLDPETIAAIQEGLRIAEEDPRRWSADEAFEFARETSQEWLKTLKNQASA